MSYVAAAAGELLLVEIETATPGTYAAPATINLARALELSATAEASVIPQKGNPSAPGRTDRVVTAVDWKCTGQGTLDVGDDKVYADWLLSGVAKNVRVSNTVTGGLVLTGLAVLVGFSVSSDGIGKKMQGSISIEGAGLPTTAAHA